MKTKAVRLYGEKDLRLEEFELPKISDGEVLIKIISDSVCMSTYKTYLQGERHIRVPNGIDKNPVIIGHEFCAEIVEVGKKWQNQYKVGEKVAIPPVLAYLPNNQTIGYSFTLIGGVSTYSIVYEHIIENGYLMKINSDAFFSASLIEPASCVLRGYKESYHLDKDHKPVQGIKEGGNVIILAGCGPMGLVATQVALYGNVRPKKVVVTDLDESRIERAKKLFKKEIEEDNGIELIFTTSSNKEDLLALTDGYGYDDVFVYAPYSSVVELGDEILAFDGCLNFFAGPTDKSFSANFNFYNVHYAQHHVSGTSGSTMEDMKDIVEMIGANTINPAVMITHIGGMDSVIETTTNLPKISGGKKLVYTHINLKNTAIDDFSELGKTDARFLKLDELVKKHNGLWNSEAEKYLLENFK